MGLDMFLEILRAFKSLAAEVTSMRLQRHMDANVRGDMVALNDGNVAVGPSTLQIQVVGAFATDVNFANMVLDNH